MTFCKVTWDNEDMTQALCLVHSHYYATNCLKESLKWEKWRAVSPVPRLICQPN